MKNKTIFIGLMVWIASVGSGCQQPGSTTSTGSAATASTSLGGSSTTTTTTTTSTTSTVNAVQIITKADPGGSFDAVLAPATGGVTVKAQRLYNLDGSLITTGNVPQWFVESRVFLTSTRTQAGAAGMTGSDTPCAYFDSFSSDNNPDTSGYYTIDGYTPTIGVGGTDIDQCAGTAAAELNQLNLYARVDRRFMGTNDKLQVIIKLKTLDAPNTAPTASSCVVGGFFDASACSNAYYTLTMRSAPAAAAKPFYILFPSAKALDLLSEAILLPINNDSSITTISIDRVKGGAVIYGLSVIRLQ